MKKYIIYTGILIFGLILGKFLFSNSPTKEPEHNHDEVAESNQMWTCSMHPQIMQPEAGDCPICGMDLIPAETGTMGLSADQFKLTENAMALANIQTTIVGNSIIDDNSIMLSGKISENKDETATQPAHFNGRIEKLHINSLGESVKKGQAIAEIYSPELIAAQQELITTYKLRESQPQIYNAVRNKFKNWKIHDSQLSRIETTGKVIPSFTIYSHVTGIVTEISVNVGAHIADGQPIFKVSNLNSVWAKFDVYENQINAFKIGQDIEVTTNANPNKAIHTKVSFIDPVLDTKTRTLKLRAVLDNRTEMFKPGMFVEGKVKNTKIGDTVSIAIPQTAVLWTGKRSVVYIKVNPEAPVFEMREITLGQQVGSDYEVVEGLNNGDEIVTNGTFTVDAAAQLYGKKSMMNKNGGKTATGHESHAKFNAKGGDKPIDNNTTIERVKVSEQFQEQLNKVFNDYISLKEALVKDNSKQSKNKAKSLVANLYQVNIKLLTDVKTHNQWKSLEKQIKTSATEIGNTNNIKIQRNHFKQLSSHLTTAVQVFGVNKTVYSQFCPMADNDNGAYWLSTEKITRNPYFGKAMLKCGEVKQVIE